jgi:hypothetical protein
MGRQPAGFSSINRPVQIISLQGVAPLWGSKCYFALLSQSRSFQILTTIPGIVYFLVRKLFCSTSAEEACAYRLLNKKWYMPEGAGVYKRMKSRLTTPLPKNYHLSINH